MSNVDRQNKNSLTLHRPTSHVCFVCWLY